MPTLTTNAAGPSPARRALRDALTLRHLHATGVDCTSAEETRSLWRRRFHHWTFYGFMLCFASTSVAPSTMAYLAGARRTGTRVFRCC